MSESLSGPPPRRSTPVRKLAVAGAALVLVAAIPGAYVAGRSAGAADADQESASTALPSTAERSPGADPLPDGEAALAIEIGDEESDSCFFKMPGRLHLLDVQWKAGQDVDTMAFRLEGEHINTGPGPIRTIAPVNIGGAIPLDGAYDADAPGAVALESPFLDESTREPVGEHAAGAGDTGLLDWPVRFTPGADRIATITALTADYTTASGESGTVEVPVDWTYRFVDEARYC